LLTYVVLAVNTLVGIGSSFLPSIPFANNFNISPTIAFGSHGLSAGLSARFRTGNFSFGFGFNTAEGNSGYSWGVGWDDGNTGFSYSNTKFSGDIKQSTSAYGFRHGNFSLQWENDLFAKGNFDRFRTNAISFSHRLNNGSSISIGSRWITGEDDGTSNINYPYEYEEHTKTLRREGVFYLGYTNVRGLSTSAGIDHERWRYGAHRLIHSITRDGVFKNLRYSYPLRGFIRYGNTNPFTHYY
jgi:hypothetical protein